MPLELQIIRACEFVRVNTHGKFDFDATRDALVDLATACQKRGVHRALLDVRGATSNFTPKDLAALVGAFAKAVFSKRLRVALLHGEHQNYRARLFAFFSAMRGRKVKAFSDFEQALAWLSSEDAPAKGASAEHEVPIGSARSSSRRIRIEDSHTNAASS